MQKIAEQKLQAFQIGTMGQRQLSRREQEERRKKEEEIAAASVSVYCCCDISRCNVFVLLLILVVIWLRCCGYVSIYVCFNFVGVQGICGNV